MSYIAEPAAWSRRNRLPDSGEEQPKSAKSAPPRAASVALTLPGRAAGGPASWGPVVRSSIVLDSALKVQTKIGYEDENDGEDD